MDTYVPVVLWYTLRMMLIMTFIFDFKAYAIGFRKLIFPGLTEVTTST